MKIAVIGTGYVGLSTGVCLAEMGHHVTCMDTDADKIARLQAGQVPIYEPGLERLMVKNQDRLLFTSSHHEGVTGADIVVLAVGTPQGEDGAADLRYLVGAVQDIRPFLKEDTVVVIKSTVPVGTNQAVASWLGGETAVVSNPEFLRQGSAVRDTLFPDRVVIGAREAWARDLVAEMYRPLGAELVLTDPESAELIKYASNAFLAMKISFINEVAALCDKVGGNVEAVAYGMGLDSRIGRAFLQAGTGYGGSCFPKDVSALSWISDQAGVSFGLLKETMQVNARQKTVLVRKLKERFGDIRGLHVAVLGLAFKPETDDMREAPSIAIVKELLAAGACVRVYDPVAMEQAKKVLGDGGETLVYAESLEKALHQAHSCLVITEWKEFVEAEWSELVTNMQQPVVFDGRNCLPEKSLKRCPSLEYYPIGKPGMKIS